MNDQLGSRMKNNYEQASRVVLPWRMPVIVRIDGRAFHTLTRGMEKPFDPEFQSCMWDLAWEIRGEIATCVLAYAQSDEISFLLHGYKKLTSQPWFGNNLQKMVSVTAGMASAIMALLLHNTRLPVFDARAFVLPEAEVCNYFIWRQKDAIRNSIQGYAQSMFSAKELHGKSQSEQLEMLEDRGFYWRDLPEYQQRGVAVRDGELDKEIPLFWEDRAYVEDLLECEV